MAVDPFQTALVGGSVTALLYTGKKVLGPTLGYFGDELKKLVEAGAPNISKILQRATELLGDRIERKESVPRRVTHEVLQAGALVDDPLQVEYFAGILAASRSEQASDDRGANLAKLVSRVSLYQLRGHYALYSVVRQLFGIIRLNRRDRCEKAVTFVHMNELLKALCLGANDDTDSIVPHVLDGLEHEGLVSDYHTWDDGRSSGERMMRFTGGKASAAGIVFEPTVRGAELFLWAHGVRDVQLFGLLSQASDSAAALGIHVPQNNVPIGRRCAEGLGV